MIKLIKSPNKKYLYDTNIHKICEISNELYEKLKTEAIMQDDSNEVFKLKKMGFLQSMRVQKLESSMIDFVDTYLERGIQKLTLQITQDCNFRCVYCNYTENNGGQRVHSKKKMDIQTAKKSIDFFMDRSIDLKESYVGFYGGEPLIEMNLIKQIVTYIEENYPYRNVVYAISTNASLLNDMNIKFLAEHDFYTLISFDGSKEIHDANRKFVNSTESTYDIVIKNIKKIAKNYPEYLKKVLLNVVINPKDDLDKVNKIFIEDDILKKMNIQQTIVDDSLHNCKNEYSEKFVAKYQYEQFVNFIDNTDKMKLSKLVVADENILKKEQEKLEDDSFQLNERQIPSGPCLAGRKRMLVNADGIVFPCEKVTETSDIMRIGDVDNGFYMKKVKKLFYISHLTPNRCLNCWAFHFCTICGKDIIHGDEFSESRKAILCKEVLSSAENTLRKVILVKEKKSIYGES